MLSNKPIGFINNLHWWVACLTFTLMIVLLYGWTVFEPYAGDALMHMMDDTQIHSVKDVLHTFYGATNPAYQEQHRLAVFHRPVFNELYLTAVKDMFGVGSIWIRAMTLATLIAAACAFLILMKEIKLHPLSGAVATAWFVFSSPLFFGLYEYGLAFSQLLVLLTVLSLLALKKYVDCINQPGAWLWAVLSLGIIFLAVFTKESAVVWPIICLLMAIYFTEGKQNPRNEHALSFSENLKYQFSILFALRWIASALFILVLLYFATRYFKLGSLTAIAGGIEQTPSVGDALIKLRGFTLLALQIPSSAIPAFMTMSLPNMGWIEIAIRLFLFISALWALWASWHKSHRATLTLLAVYLLAFLPIIKVSRNAPYYGDLMSIPVAIALGLGFEAIREKVQRPVYTVISVLLIASLFIVGGFFASRYIYNSDMWLARSQGFMRSALADFSSAEGMADAQQIVGTSGMFSPEQSWALSHDPSLFGSAFIVNLSIPKERFIVNSGKLLQNDKVLFIDFEADMHPRKVGAYRLPGYGRLTTAYFPTGFIRKALKLNSADGTYNINGSKVVRLECGNPFQKSFEVIFKSYSKTEQSRRIDEAMNLSSSPGKMVFEFVAPSDAASFQLVSDAAGSCQSPKVIGYFAFEPSKLRYSITINASTRFQKDSDWNGKLLRDPRGTGVIVGPGADNINVLSQKIPVQPFEHFRILARASNVYKSNAIGRLQINWVGKDGKFISSSGKTIEVVKKEGVFDMQVVSPAGAVAGIVYVSPHTSGDVVRYSEMRVLGAAEESNEK